MSVFKSLFDPHGEASREEKEGWTILGSGYAIGPKTASGERITPDKALTIADYFACVRNISEDLGKLPLKVYRKLRPRGKEELPDHPAYRLLHNEPNPDMTAIAFRETLTSHAVTWHGGFAEIERDGTGRPIAFWSIHPSRVALKRVDGRLVYIVRVQDTEWHEVAIEQRNMLHIHGLGGAGTHGYMLSDLSKECAGLAIAARRFAASFFGNGTHLSGALKHPGSLGEKAQKNLRASWQKQYATPEGWHTPAILEEGMDWVQLGVNPEEAQFIETRQFSTEEFARWFRMPPHKIQHLIRSTFSNIESQNIEYVVDCLTPWAVRWEQEIDRKALKEPDVFSEHNMTALLRGDQAGRSTYYRNQFMIGALSQNDIRDLENQNGIGPAGDVYYVPLNMVPSDVAATQKPEERTASVGAPTNDNQGARVAALPLFEEAANRVLSKEALAVRRALRRFDGAPDGYAAWVDGFFREQERYLSQELELPAWSYCTALGGAAVVASVGAAIGEYAEAFMREARTEAASLTEKTVESWSRVRGERLPGEIAMDAADIVEKEIHYVA